MSRARPEPDDLDAALRLEQKAYWALEHPEEIPPALHGLQRRLRLWSYPVRGTPRAWGLFLSSGEGRDDDRPRVREVAWNKQADTRRSSSPMRLLKRHPRPWPGPTIRVRDAEIFRADLQPFLDWAGRAEFQPLAGPDVPDEGDAQGIEGSGPLTHLKIQWRGQAPPALEEPAYWIEQLRRLLEGALDDRRRSESR